jgi:hypothetical protein
LNVKPAVGFTLPSAGVTPAPSEKEIAKWRGQPFALRFLILVAQALACDFLVHAIQERITAEACATKI